MKKSLKSLFVLSSIVLLTSCGDGVSTSAAGTSSIGTSTSVNISSDTSTPTTTTTPSTTSIAPTTSTASNSSTSPKPSTSSTPKPTEGGSLSLYQSVLDKGYDQQTLPALGNPKTLILPVDFSDRTCNSLAGGCQGSYNRINDAFFGERSSPTENQSVSSFYNYSSYGKLNIEGEVAPWYRVKSKSFSSLTALTDWQEQSEAIAAIIDEALAEFAKTNDLSQFNADNDEYIDAIWVVYSGEYEASSTAINWAFVTDSYSENAVQDLYPYRYGWASYSFLDDGGYGDSPDVHTFVHETGHLLGLDDYYDTSANTNLSPAGGIDMMDSNIGDHHVFSKYLLGWVEPTLITTSTTITLKPFSDTGECAIIGAPTYNGTSLSEYITLQYYTPTALNKIDSETAYMEWLKGYSESGLLMFHADASIGKIDIDSNNNASWDGVYINEGFEDIDVDFETTNSIYMPVHSNSPDYSFSSNTSHKLYEILDNNPTSYIHDYTTDNKALYKEGDSFGVSNYQQKTWHNGSSLDFSITVDKVTAEEMTITITFAS